MKNIIVVVLLVFMGGGAFAQGKLTDEKRKEFDAQKVICHRLKRSLSGLCIMKCKRKTGR